MNELSNLDAKYHSQLLFNSSYNILLKTSMIVSYYECTDFVVILYHCWSLSKRIKFF